MNIPKEYKRKVLLDFSFNYGDREQLNDMLEHLSDFRKNWYDYLPKKEQLNINSDLYYYHGEQIVILIDNDEYCLEFYVYRKLTKEEKEKENKKRRKLIERNKLDKEEQLEREKKLYDKLKKKYG